MHKEMGGKKKKKSNTETLSCDLVLFNRCAEDLTVTNMHLPVTCLINGIVVV